MPLATTGVPAAIASISTTPNDSPCSDGAQKIDAPRRRANFSASLIRPSQLMRASWPYWARSWAVSGPSLAIHSRASGRSDWNASSSTARPLRCSWRPQKKIVGCAVGVGAVERISSISTPLKRMSYSPGIAAWTSSRASFDTTTLRSMRCDAQRTNQPKIW